MCDTKSVLHDATPSWNGYNYQGKVGLYVCLKNIRDKLESGINETDFDKYITEHHIEYEWIEDFSIKRNDKYLTLHQVKHKNDNKFSDHIEAIATILNRKNGVLPNSDIFRYFELPTDKEESEGIKSEILTDIANCKLFDASGRLSDSWKNKIKNIDSSFINQLSKCFYDFESLYNNAFKNSKVYFHTVSDIKKPVKNIDEYKGIPGDLIIKNKDEKNLASQDVFFSFDNVDEYKLSLSDEDLNKKTYL